MRYLHVLLFVIIFFVFVGCGDKHTAKKIHKQLEETVEIEKQFEKEGQEIYELERKDEALYEEMIALGNEDYEKIVELAKEANELVDERRQYTDKEKETMEKSKEAFMQVKELAGKREGGDKEKQLDELIEVMMERYELYDDVYDKYMAALDDTEALYTIFQNKKVSDKKLYAMLNQINESYDNVNAAYESFNMQTEKFNELKKQYISKTEE